MAVRSEEAMLARDDLLFDVDIVAAGTELPLSETRELTGVSRFVSIVLLDRVEVEGVALPID